MSTNAKIIAESTPDGLTTPEFVDLPPRAKIMLEASAVAADIRTLNERIAGLGMTPKHLREERRDQMLRERTVKVQRLVELKKQFDALSPSTPAK